MCEFDMREVKGNYNQGHVLEPMRMRNAGEAMAMVAKARTMARTRSRKRSTVGTREHEVGCGCLTSTQTKREGGNWPICLTSTRPDTGMFIADDVDKIQSFYERK